ncbi:MAG: hypothetical protein ACUVXI_17675, partial [bacterium]
MAESRRAREGEWKTLESEVASQRDGWREGVEVRRQEYEAVWDGLEDDLDSKHEEWVEDVQRVRREGLKERKKWELKLKRLRDDWDRGARKAFVLEGVRFRASLKELRDEIESGWEEEI